VVRRGETILEEVDERGLRRHPLERSQFSVAVGHEQVSRPAAARPPEILIGRLELRDGWKLLRRRIELLLHVMLERVGFLLDATASATIRPRSK
jgi:hypothetical protein